MSMHDGYINLLKEHFNISEEELEGDFSDFDDTNESTEECDDEDDIQEANDTSAGGEFNVPGAFQHTNPTASDKNKNRQIATSSTGYTVVEGFYNRMSKVTAKLNQDLEKLSEASYKEWATDDSSSPRQKINSVIHEVNRKLYEVESMVRRAHKLKSEGDMGQDVYLKGTLPKITKIGERILKISNIIREMSK